jgi:hypothetical protein
MDAKNGDGVTAVREPPASGYELERPMGMTANGWRYAESINVRHWPQCQANFSRRDRYAISELLCSLADRQRCTANRKRLARGCLGSFRLGLSLGEG